MINKKSLGCLLIVLIQSITSAQWISIDKYSTPDSPPVVQLISDDAFSTVIKVDLPGFYINEFSAEGKTYQSISFDAEGITTEVGFPEIPHIAKILAIPDQGTVSVEILETSPVQTFKGINIPPARESWEEGKPETAYLENPEAYNSDNIYPGNFARVEDPAVFRDFRIARVSIFPIRYSPSKKKFRQFLQLQLKLII
jgi:hypothetical protein